MKNKTKNFILLAAAIILLFLTNHMFKDYNLKRTISACVMALKQTSESFDPKTAKEICEREIKKSK